MDFADLGWHRMTAVCDVISKRYDDKSLATRIGEVAGVISEAAFFMPE